MRIDMEQGPLYIQMLVEGGDVWVVEAGGRVGGGHEASLIPMVTGVDLTDRMIDLALTGRADPVGYDYRKRPSRSTPWSTSSWPAREPWPRARGLSKPSPTVPSSRGTST